jgi:ParB family chromosome partitioning protein
MAKEKKKQQLGKGIRALLANIEDVPPDTQERQSAVREISKSVAQVPIDLIEANPHQPRKEFDTEGLEQLAQSIRTHGIIQPLTLRRLSDEAYQIIAGERRLRAAQKAGLEAVPAYIRLADDQTLLEMALVENIQREDLNALEVAISMSRLITECDLTHEQLSERIGKDRSTVTNYLRLLKLPPEIQGAVRTRKITMGHARALAGITDLSLQLSVFQKVLAAGLSVRALEELIKSYHSSTASTPPKSTQMDSEIKRIQDKLSGIFGSRVAIKRNTRGTGTLTIHFSSDDALNDILDMLYSVEDQD